MYIPAQFHETNPACLDWLAAHDAFGTLISMADAAPVATHLPVLYERTGARVLLTGHWARGNPQWQSIKEQRVLFIFHGPHAYISPRWYTNPEANVPTWDYATAHLYGRIRLVEDPAMLRKIVSALAAYYESAAKEPWRMNDSEESAKRLRGIVGFELAVDDIQVKFKLNQNHPASNIEGTIAGLRAQGGAGSLAVAALMQEALDKRPRP